MPASETIAALATGVMDTKLRAGKFYVPVQIVVREGRMEFDFAYNPDLINDIKTSMEGRKYHGYIDGDNRKIWSAPLSYRNIFQLETMQGKHGPDPYSKWENINWNNPAILRWCEEQRHKPIVPYQHQVEMIAAALSTHWFLWGAEMGLGKSLGALLLMEILQHMGAKFQYEQLYWAGPRSALASVRLEIRKWDFRLPLKMMTYDGLKKEVAEWADGKSAPRVLILDESSRCKTPTAQRSVQAKHMADSMRREHGWENCYIGEMSGTPSPKHPTDWWMQCEILAPGFISEANIHSFRKRLAIVQKVEGDHGTFNKVIDWKDDPSKCEECGKPDGHPNHQKTKVGESWAAITGQTHELHDFSPCKDEVGALHKRLNGLVHIWLKKDCLDLPERRFKLYEVEPSRELLNAAKLVVAQETRACDVLLKLRMLSDGFLYKEKDTGRTQDCPGCKASGVQLEHFHAADPDRVLSYDEISKGYLLEWVENDDTGELVPIRGDAIDLQTDETTCWHCGGDKIVQVFERFTDEVPCKKDDVLIELLEQHEECGRLVVYAGFQGSIDRIGRICRQRGWWVLRADGRGWGLTHPDGTPLPMKDEEMLWEFQEGKKYGKVCFTGQPGAAGMGLTLTASPGNFFYSNDFNPESRAQAVDRIHRIGMDVVRGGWVYDVVHLPSDRKVLDSLKRSMNLQHLSMTGLRDLFND